MESAQIEPRFRAKKSGPDGKMVCFDPETVMAVEEIKNLGMDAVSVTLPSPQNRLSLSSMVVFVLDFKTLDEYFDAIAGFEKERENFWAQRRLKRIEEKLLEKRVLNSRPRKKRLKPKSGKKT